MFAEYIKNRLGVTTYGIEISPSDCKLAKKRVDQLFCASISEPGIYKKIDRQFDVAISSDVFEHIPNPHESMGNISQLVKPGGLLVVDTGDIGGFGAKLGGNKNPFTMDDGHIVFYSRKTLTRLLIEHGFDVLSVYDESQIYPAEKFSFGSLISKIKRFFISSPNITVIARKIDPSSAQMSQQNFV